MVIEQKAIVGKLKKFPSGIQQLFSLASNFRSCEEVNGLFCPLALLDNVNKKQEDGEKSDSQLSTGEQPGDISRPLSQTYPQWKVMLDVHQLHSLQTRKRFKNRTMYILPMGIPDEKATADMLVNEYQQNGMPNYCSNMLGAVIKFTSLFFYGMDVKLLPFHDIQSLGFTMRVHSRTNKTQVLVTDILGYLKKIRPKDSFCIVAWSSLDLYPCSELNFVLGEACFDTGCAVVSYGRYADVAYRSNLLSPDESINGKEYPGSIRCSGTPYDDVDDQEGVHVAAYTSSTPAPCLAVTHLEEDSNWNSTNLGGKVVWRLLKVLSHEVCHLLGMHHCTFFACLMNESSNVTQAQDQPLFLCPVCLRKLHKFLNFSIVSRYMALKDFMEQYCVIVARKERLSNFSQSQEETVQFPAHSARLDRITTLSSSDENSEETSRYDIYTVDKFRTSLNWLDSVLKLIR